MRINSIQSYNQNPPVREKKNGEPSFGGNLSVNFWDAIARGGFAASFTVQDMTGTNFPRTYQALQRNKDMTGKNNYKAAAEVAIREFLTGPSMCVIPMLVLAAANKKVGSAMEVPLENIDAFSKEMKNVLKANPRDGFDIQPEYAGKIKSQFYEKMFSLALEETEQTPSNGAKELASMLEQYDAAPKRGFFKQLLNKDLTDKAGNKLDTKDQIFNNIVAKYTDIKKASTNDYSELLVSNMSGSLKKKNKIGSLVKDFSNFANDFKKSMLDYSPDNGVIKTAGFNFDSFTDEFKAHRTGSKFITNIAMVAATALFMIKIPKLYTLYKTNPETDAFRDEKGGITNANQ